MGHSCLVFNGQMWVIGGWAKGNPLNDAWYLDTGNNVWKQTDTGGWHGGCLFAAAVHTPARKVPKPKEEPKLYLYGGMREPFSSTFYSDTWVVEGTGDKARWNRLDRKTEVKGTECDKPLASCLALLNDKLYLLAAFKEGEQAVPRFFEASDVSSSLSSGNWKSSTYVPELSRDPLAFHLLAVEYGVEGARRLVVRALGEDSPADQVGLFVYAPPR